MSISKLPSLGHKHMASDQYKSSFLSVMVLKSRSLSLIGSQLLEKNWMGNESPQTLFFSQKYKTWLMEKMGKKRKSWFL